MRDDIIMSGDDTTYADGYTVESQSQYTMEKDNGEEVGQYGDEDNDKGRRSNKGAGGRNNRNPSSSYNDPVESVGFLDT